MRYVRFFNEISKEDVGIVGGKTANLGEMVSLKLPVPPGFATTAEAYRFFLKQNKIWPAIKKELDKIKDPNDTKTIKKVGAKVRSLILGCRIPKELIEEIKLAYEKLGKIANEKEPYVAIRSSATAEDLPGASFAGQQETYLNVKGWKEVLKKILMCYASLFTDRAIFYRIQKGFPHEKVALSAIVQKMVFSESSGVMFTLNVENGDESVISIEGSYGLGEYIVQGKVIPDLFLVRKKDLAIIEKRISDKKIALVRKEGQGTIQISVPKNISKKQVIPDEKIKELAKYGLLLEKHYRIPQDIEWALEKNKIYILQTRPETVWSERKEKITTEKLKGEVIIQGLGASPGVAVGKVKILKSIKDIIKIEKGDILVTTMTNPDMVPVMKKAAAIITDLGGVTSHAAIVSRELGIPCVTGTENATKMLTDDEEVTVDGTSGKVYRGILKIEEKKEEKVTLKTKTKVYVNLAIPDLAEKIAKENVDGVGLFRLEFLLAQYGEHPLYILEKHEEDKFIKFMVREISKVTKAFYPRPVILRFSDLKSNEYRSLKGGEKYEPIEQNPMIGWRGCSRYISPEYEKAFRLEIEIVKQVRKKYDNLHVMLPFPRTIAEVKRIREILEESGLDLKKMHLYLMAETPANIILVEEFSKYCDGFSIGSNDLTQLILGVDRDSEMLA
ncbi:MAG: phosphoenolpyruvate synthase, partial [archaeon]